MEAVVPAVAVSIIIGAPLLHGFASFYFVENILVRLLLVLAVALAVRQGPMEGLLVFLAVMTLITERNHEVLTILPAQQPHWPSNNQGVPVQAPPLVGVPTTVHYVPVAAVAPAPVAALQQPLQQPPPKEGSTMDDKFEGAADIQDGIPRIPAAPGMKGAPAFYKEKGLAN